MLTRKLLSEQPDLKSLFELPAIADNWVRTYESVSGKKDGEMKFNAEKIMFLQTISQSKALEKCDKFTIYSAFIELAISGLTLRDGIAYVVPFGKTATFMPGWRGRLEQINDIPSVVHCHEPQIVYDCDLFDYEKGEKVKINKHKPGERVVTTKITHVYFVIEFKHGAEVYIMDAVDVLNIRDKYSSSYKTYVKDCIAAGKQIGETWKKTVSYNGSSWDVDVEIPMWVSDEAQAFKKTIVKRVYGTLPKLPKQKWLDERIKIIEKEGLDAEELKDSAKVIHNYDDFIDLPAGEEQQGNTQTTTPIQTTMQPKSEPVKPEVKAELVNNSTSKVVVEDPGAGF